MNAHDILATEADTCESPMCQRAASVTLTFLDTGSRERFCHIHAEELVGR